MLTVEIAKTWYRTDACGRQHGPYRTIILDQDEWDEKAKTHKVEKPYVRNVYELGCGWERSVYEMAIREGDDTFFLKGHEKCLESECRETMNEYNS